MEPMEPNEPQSVEKKPEGSAGPIIGTIIILIVIVLGGLYFWGQSNDPVDMEVENINTQSESDELSDIEADLDATDLDVGAELDAE